MPHAKPDIPLGIRCIQKLVPNVVITSSKNVGSRALILFLTYIIYTSYHASRKPLSVVKSQLHRNCSGLNPPGPMPNDTNWCDWAPFNGEDSNSLFGLLDSAFLFSYAFAMFFSGFVAERSNLRYFLSGGVLLSGIACYLLGVSREYDIHNIWYFVIVQIFGGIFQTTGWPGVVAVMGNWFGEGKTGFIFGVWNSHTSVGNILGTLIAGHYVESNWGYSFITLAYVMIGLSVIVFLFLLPEPSQPRTNGRAVNTETDDHSGTTGSEDTDDKARVEQRPILTHNVNVGQAKPIGFFDAVCVPGVIEFSLCLFFAKLVSYTFLYWLPFYINNTTKWNVEMSATLSTLFDVGGIFGGIFAGLVSDATGLQACTCAIMIICSIPSLYMYSLFGDQSEALSIILLLVTGALVNGPYALITTAVSARLGVDPSLAENSKAISTVTAIIDGMGSIGAAVGPLLTGFVSTYGSWDEVFIMLMVADFFALLTLSRLLKNEVNKFSRSRVHGWSS
ncbi:glucose-6-phosphate exchanger SLC37A2 isoform X2 [Planococcus citri]|uniref:glucose-6-phosphate exchanger SLC37A2 isoform X2 n=1 Tax=Planococcus citri TaxID=170843 RepID=UPI0031F739F5